MNWRVGSTSRERGCVLHVLCCGLAAAQDAQISGLIFDSSKSIVAGADIALRNEQTGGRRTARANNAGFYNLSALRPGLYRLTVRAAGFETVVREGVVLEVGENARLDFEFQIGEPQTTITVNSGPPLVNLEDAGVGTVIDRKLIDQMPLNGRGIQTLIELAPGVNALPVSDASRGQFSINGQRSDANYFTVDGISASFAAGNSNTVNLSIRGGLPAQVGQAGGGMLPANNFLGTSSNLVAPEGLQEFKIQTSTYAPESGHLAGGKIDLVSRSGGNRYSGSLFEYLRNDKTDANDWFNNVQALSKPPLRFNNFGGTFGGLVRFGRRYDGRNRTFFFLSVDELVASEPQPLVTTEVPSLAARQNAPAPFAPFLALFPLPNGAAAKDTGYAFYTGATLLSASSVYLGLVQKNRASQLEWADNLFYARGSQRWKFGADYRALRIGAAAPILTGLVKVSSVYNPDGSFISTDSSAFSTAPLYPKTAYLEPSFSAYAQDTWRISNVLTMTYGIRWEVAPAPRTTDGSALVAGGSRTSMTSPRCS